MPGSLTMGGRMAIPSGGSDGEEQAASAERLPIAVPSAVAVVLLCMPSTVLTRAAPATARR